MKMIVVPFVAALSACGSSPEDEKTAARNIRQVSEVTDLSISEAAPQDVAAKAGEATIGFDDEGRESRFFLFFPGLTALYDENVVTSSVTSIEVQVAVRDVAVNPENIDLYAIKAAWSPFTTWRSRYRSLPGLDWTTPGGDLDLDQTPVHPAVRPSTRNPEFKELTFDVTSLAVDRLVAGQPNLGFAVLVRRSPLNGVDRLTVQTANGSQTTRPIAALVFNTSDTIDP